jgi:hypothetical protein
MSNIAFGRSFGQLEAGHVHPAIGAIDKFLKYAIYVWNVPWLFLLLQSLPGFQDPMTIIRRYAEESLRKREKVRQAWLFKKLIVNRLCSIGGTREPRCHVIHPFEQRDGIQVAIG